MSDKTVVAVPLDWLKPDKVERRERIATACLQGLLACPGSGEGLSPENTARVMCQSAVMWADALIEELDK